MGPDWRGIMDFDPVMLTRERIIDSARRSTRRRSATSSRAARPSRSRRRCKGFCDAGMRVFKLLDYGGMAGLKFSADSAAKVRETEDELLQLVEGA